MSSYTPCVPNRSPAPEDTIPNARRLVSPTSVGACPGMHCSSHTLALGIGTRVRVKTAASGPVPVGLFLQFPVPSPGNRLLGWSGQRTSRRAIFPTVPTQRPEHKQWVARTQLRYAVWPRQTGVATSSFDSSTLHVAPVHSFQNAVPLKTVWLSCS